MLRTPARIPWGLYLALARATTAADDAALALQVLGVEPQECGGDVARIAECLSDVPPAGCEAYAAEVVAALRLRAVKR
jgi:hypothetical protein